MSTPTFVCYCTCASSSLNGCDARSGWLNRTVRASWRRWSHPTTRISSMWAWGRSPGNRCQGNSSFAAACGHFRL